MGSMTTLSVALASVAALIAGVAALNVLSLSRPTRLGNDSD